jgi:hypothetical protein
MASVTGSIGDFSRSEAIVLSFELIGIVDDEIHN